MKSKIFITLGIIMCIAGTVIAAAGLEPGSADDPLVTKSYVDSVISNGGGSSEYVVKTYPAGTTILGHQNCEIILRSGAATINSYKAADGTENGVQDVTDGVDLTDGKKCPLNHLLIVPRTDTRGITTTTDVYVMIKGGYEIK